MTDRNQNSFIDLSEKALMTMAQQQTGLSNWGNLKFLEGMRILLKACQDEAELSHKGQQWLQNECVQLLSNRLQIEETLKQHPEILDIPIQNPLFISTLPRTGSTFLHRLLAQDLQARTLPYWELRQPALIPTITNNSIDPRIALAEKAANEEIALFPNQKSMHFIDANSPEECYYLLQNDFASFDTTFWYNIPTYHQWLCQVDLTESYRYYKKQLQILLWRKDGQPLILKNPGHLLGIKAIKTVFPDANIIQLHRSPRQLIASLCNLQMNYQNSLRKRPLTAKEVGSLVINRWLVPLEKSMSWYKKANKPQVYNINYKDILINPLDSISSIYQHFNYSLSPKTRVNMNKWLKNNLHNKHGKHYYNLETFGLTEAKVDEIFGHYCQQYQDFL